MLKIVLVFNFHWSSFLFFFSFQKEDSLSTRAVVLFSTKARGKELGSANLRHFGVLLVIIHKPLPLKSFSFFTLITGTSVHLL